MKFGKLSKELMESLIYRYLGASDNALIVPPTKGIDFSVIDIGDYSLIVEVDPFFVVPEYGWERSAWFAVHILASDVAVSGVPPRYLFVDLNLPLKMSEEDLKALWINVHKECLKLGVSIAGGHTGRYEGTDFPMIGGAVMIGVAKRGEYVTPAMARPGDYVIMTKGPGIETAGILSVMFPDVLKKHYGEEFADRAERLFWEQSVVKDALTLAKLGLRTGVTGMHDATEFGVWGALHDVKDASGYGVRVYENKLFIRDEVKKVVELFSRLTHIDVDVYSSISEGTLIATVNASLANEALRLLRSQGIDASVIGEVIDKPEVELIKKDGSKKQVELPEEDPFWILFSETRKLFGERK
jgi:hydrogenase maturation factor